MSVKLTVSLTPPQAGLQAGPRGEARETLGKSYDAKLVDLFRERGFDVAEKPRSTKGSRFEYVFTPSPPPSPGGGSRAGAPMPSPPVPPTEKEIRDVLDLSGRIERANSRVTIEDFVPPTYLDTTDSE